MESIIHPKVSVITVVYNDVEHIRETIESFFSQTWEEKEYIVIDGGSTDGTADVVREYADQLSYWCSEADKGIYDAMNKGIEKATGDWINFLNCGDYYATADSLRNVMESEHAETADVLFGDSIAVIDECRKEETAPSDVSLLEMIPTFRHGSSLIRTSVQRQYKFDLSRKQQLGYSLDWEMLYRVYKSGRRFCKVDTIIQAYLKEGISNHQYKNLWYNYLITSQGHFCPKKYLFFIRRSTDTFIKDSSLYRLMRDFLLEFVVNDILHYIPFWTIRKWYLRMVGTKIGKGSFIMKNNYIMNARLLSIGAYSHINRDCIVDARGTITIGNNVSISHRVNIMTGGHDARSSDFMGVFKPIVIDDYAWLGVDCTILQGVTIGKGAVVSAGAVVTKDVAPYSIVAGVPAKQIGERPQQLNYHCKGWLPFT